MKFIVLVYTNGRIVQDIMFTGQLVNLIHFHKKRFKAKNHLSLHRDYPLCSLFESVLLYFPLILSISFMWGIVGKNGFKVMVMANFRAK